MKEATEMTMATLLETITTIFTSCISWVGTVATTVASQPLLLLGVVVGFVGLGIGLFQRLLNL